MLYRSRAMSRPFHPVVHLELSTSNAGRACAFYERLLGWRAQTVHVGGGRYLSLELSRAADGGVVETDDERALWLPYVGVDDVHDATARARRLGAAVVLEPREGPAGWRSVVSSPAGGRIAFWQAKAGPGGAAGP